MLQRDLPTMNRTLGIAREQLEKIEKDLADETERLLKAFGKQLEELPFQSERMLSALDFHYRRPREAAFVARQADRASLDVLIDAAWRRYVPNVVFARLLSDSADAVATAKKIPLLAGKTPAGGKPCAYVCKNFACRAPVTDPAKLIEELDR
jgi:uncharacterized protein YyaL (SSP411 family)